MENYLEDITNNFTIFEKELSKSKCLNEFVNKLEQWKIKSP